MMKRALLFAFCSFISLAWAQAQTCTPAQNFPDTAIAIPPSWSPLRLMGGIQDTACIGQYFEFTLSIKAPAAIPGLPGVTVNSIAIPAANGVANMPQGMTYVCNPPNCVFPRDTVACIKMFGIPNNPADVGQKDLTLSLTINTSFGQLSNIPYPNAQLDPGGHYYLNVKPAGSSNCFVSSDREADLPVTGLYSRPNPTSGFTQIEANVLLAGQYEFRVTDLAGAVLHRRMLQLYNGENVIDFDGSHLPAGMYLYSLNNGSRAVTEKLIISRR